MPGYKGHLVGGAISFLILLAIFQNHVSSSLTYAEWLCASLCGCLFPDIDIKSKGQQLFYKLLLIITLGLLFLKKYMAGTLVCLFSFTPLMCRHRGLFHKAWFIIFLGFLFFAFMSISFPKYAHIVLYDIIFFVFGALSHLYLDLGWRRMWRY